MAGALVTLALLGVHADAAPGDPLLGEQWALSVTGTAAAWGRSEGAGITVAVVDSGIDDAHPDLSGAVSAGTACFGTGGDPNRCAGPAADDDGHGTHVAGLIAARRNNGAGIAGVAPRAGLLAVRVLSATCQPQTATQLCEATGTSSDISAGIRWATAHGADVINVSIAADLDAQGDSVLPIGDAVRDAWQRGAIVVVATGNDFSALMGPGYDQVPVVAVAASDRNDQHAIYSNTVADAMWAVAAPGGVGPQGTCPDDDMISDYPGGQYKCMAGTSVAAPMVSGTLALLRAAGLSPADAVSRLLATVKDLGPPGRDPDFGVGRIDVTNAVARLPVVTAPVAARSVQAARAAAPRPTSQSAAHPVHPVLHPSAPTRVASPPPPAVPALAGSGGAGRSPSQPAAPGVPIKPVGQLMWWWPALAVVLLAGVTTATLHRVVLSRRQ